jgi:hypothetical protein
VCGRTLKSIAAFSKERAERSTLERLRKKQNDADDIKKWEKELTRAFERFTVCQMQLFSYMINPKLLEDLCFTSYR